MVKSIVKEVGFHFLYRNGKGRIEFGLYADVKKGRGEQKGCHVKFWR